MRRKLDAIRTRFPGLYRHDLLQFRMKEMGLTDLQLAELLRVNRFCLRRILNGEATGGKTVWPVAEYLGLDWAQLHNLTLKESDFPLAVVNGGSRR